MQTDLAQQIKASLENTEVNASWIVVGSRGIGKRQFATDLAQSLTGITSEYNPNVKWLKCDYTETVKKEIQKTILAGQAVDNLDTAARKTEITVDDIRAGCQFLSLKSKVLKILIIDLADDMNENAQNALLKTLEEPYPNSFILLLCENTGKLLSTILSRCCIGHLHELSHDDLLKKLIEKHGDLSEDVLTKITDLADGSFGVAEDLINNNGIELYEDIVRLARPKKELSLTHLMEFFDRILSMENGFELVKYLILHYVHFISKEIANQSLEEGYDYADLYQFVNQLWRDQQSLNLDKRQTLLNAFYQIGGVIG